MPRKLIKRKMVRERVGKADSTIDRLEREGRFPQRVRVSTNSVAWFEDEVDEWLNNLPRGGVKRPEPAIAERARRRAELAAETS